MPGAVDLLLRARELITAGWTQRTDARAADGSEIEPWAEDAVSWSLLGAIVAALEEQADADHELPLEELAAALHVLARFIDDDSLSGWNDASRRTRDEVVAVLAAAAEAARPPPSPARSAD